MSNQQQQKGAGADQPAEWIRRAADAIERLSANHFIEARVDGPKSVDLVITRRDSGEEKARIPVLAADLANLLAWAACDLALSRITARLGTPLSPLFAAQPDPPRKPLTMADIDAIESDLKYQRECLPGKLGEPLEYVPHPTDNCARCGEVFDTRVLRPVNGELHCPICAARTEAGL